MESYIKDKMTSMPDSVRFRTNGDVSGLLNVVVRYFSEEELRPRLTPSSHAFGVRINGEEDYRIHSKVAMPSNGNGKKLSGAKGERVSKAYYEWLQLHGIRLAGFKSCPEVLGYVQRGEDGVTRLNARYIRGDTLDVRIARLRRDRHALKTYLDANPKSAVDPYWIEVLHERYKKQGGVRERVAETVKQRERLDGPQRGILEKDLAEIERSTFDLLYAVYQTVIPFHEIGTSKHMPVFVDLASEAVSSGKTQRQTARIERLQRKHYFERFQEDLLGLYLWYAIMERKEKVDKNIVQDAEGRFVFTKQFGEYVKNAISPLVEFHAPKDKNNSFVHGSLIPEHIKIQDKSPDRRGRTRRVTICDLNEARQGRKEGDVVRLFWNPVINMSDVEEVELRKRLTHGLAAYEVRGFDIVGELLHNAGRAAFNQLNNPDNYMELVREKPYYDNEGDHEEKALNDVYPAYVPWHIPVIAENLGDMPELKGLLNELGIY